MEVLSKKKKLEFRIMKIQFKFTFYTLKKITIISFSLEKAFETNSKYIFEKKHSRIISNSFFFNKKISTSVYSCT